MEMGTDTDQLYSKTYKLRNLLTTCQLTVHGGGMMGADTAQLYSKTKYQSDPFNLHLAYTLWVDGADTDQLYIIYTPRIKPVASIKLYINLN